MAVNLPQSRTPERTPYPPHPQITQNSQPVTSQKQNQQSIPAKQLTASYASQQSTINATN